MSAQFFLGHLQFSASCLAAGVPHLADSGWLPYSCGEGLACGWGALVLMSCYPLGFYLVPAQFPLLLLPLRGSAPLPGASACLAPACWSSPGVGLEGSLLRHLVFSHVPCSSSEPAARTVFPAAGSLRVFRSPGVCPSASLVTWVGLSPSLLSGLLLLRLLVGVLHPVSGCSSCDGVCLG